MSDASGRTEGDFHPALSVDAARLRAEAAAGPMTGQERLTLDDAIGRVTAAPVTAASALPPFDTAAMDGYALRLSDLVGDGPWHLPVALRIAAGDGRALSLVPGTAARIFTGAPVPAGADAVVMQEQVARSGDRVTLTARPGPGRNIRRRGEDMGQGHTALPAGLALTAPRLALLAGCGVRSVAVRPPVRVAILSTGDELLAPGEAPGPGRIYDANRVLLRATLSRLPWVALTDLGILRDDAARIRSAIRDAAATHDVVISSGGVSAGAADHVRDALRAEAADLDVLKVAIRPGKPLSVEPLLD